MSDGRFGGYVSGDCVEAAVAEEALLAVSEGRDRTVKFGKLTFFDVVLPCDGGISVAMHLLRTADVLQHSLDRLWQRQPAALRYSPQTQTLSVAEASGYDMTNWRASTSDQDAAHSLIPILQSSSPS